MGTICSYQNSGKALYGKLVFSRELIETAKSLTVFDVNAMNEFLTQARTDQKVAHISSEATRVKILNSNMQKISVTLTDLTNADKPTHTFPSIAKAQNFTKQLGRIIQPHTFAKYNKINQSTFENQGFLVTLNK
jgi:hypothetical protein